MWSTFTCVLTTTIAPILTWRVTHGCLTELSSVSYYTATSVRGHTGTAVLTRLAADWGCTCRVCVAMRAFTSIWVDALSIILAGRVANRCLTLVACEALRTFAGVRCNALSFVLAGKDAHRGFTALSGVLRVACADAIFATASI